MSEKKSTSLLKSVAYHLLAAILILSIASINFDLFFWKVGGDVMHVIFIMAAMYLIGALILIVYGKFKPINLLLILSMPLACLFIVYFYIIFREIEISRLVLLITSFSMVALFLAHYVFSSFRNILSLVLAFLVVSINTAILLFDLNIKNAMSSSEIQTDEISSAFYDLKTQSYTNVFPATKSYHAMGALDLLDNDYLISTGDGDFYVVEQLDFGKEVVVKKIDINLPMNRDTFIAAAGPGSLDYSQYFRVMDIDVSKIDDSSEFKLLVSHHFWYTDRECSVFRVSENTFDKEKNNITSDWKTIFEATPCLPLDESEWAFRGMEGGGRIAHYNNKILITIGDHGMNGHDFEKDYVNDESSSYGKTILLDPLTGETENFSIGHRNQQGLLVDNNNNVWSTEHGPQGGDELNLLHNGQFYGWPQVTYGTDYGVKEWPLSQGEIGRHDNYTAPIYSWIPSVGASNLIQIKNNKQFPLWKNDFLVATMIDNTILRLRLEENNVKYQEKIAFDGRVRDILEDNDGRIILWTDENSLVLIASDNSK